MRPSSARASLGLGLCLALGCGLRSDPLFVADTDFGTSGTSGDTDDDSTGFVSSSSSGDDSSDFPPPVEGRVGSCTNPIELPTTDSEVMGELRGPGLYTTECGAAEGLEDVYILSPPSATDVTITFDPALTDFNPIVRVSEFACGPDGVVLRACTNDWFAAGVGDPRHFIAPGNRDFFIQIDSDAGGGNYGFDISFGPVPTPECEVHPETIVQQPGSRFLWQNDFPAGMGVADSFCGGVGRENFFPLEILAPGPVTVTATGTAGFRPMLSVRTDCSALTEVECTSDQILQTPFFAFLEVFLEPGLYYLAVDTLGLDAGGYDLEVAF